VIPHPLVRAIEPSSNLTILKETPEPLWSTQLLPEPVFKARMSRGDSDHHFGIGSRRRKKISYDGKDCLLYVKSDVVSGKY